MILLWAFEIMPVEGEAWPDPKDAQFTDAVISYVHPYSLWVIVHSFDSKLQWAGRFPLPIPTAV